MKPLPDPSALSNEELAAQLVFPRLGSNIPPRLAADDDAERFKELLAAYPFGGLILFNGDAETTPEVLRELQSASTYPLLVATDMEAGLGQQLRGATEFPHAMAYAAAGNRAESLLTESATIAAKEALAAGVHITLAPVADVHRNPRNPIISIRAFSSDPNQAGSLAAAYVRAVREAGMLSTAKHFPNHGGTSGDSHDSLPSIDDDLPALKRTDFVPFVACIEAGVDLVMTAHISVPSLDPTGRPATLSRPILQGVLREQLGFNGVIISDSMMMKGVLGSVERPAAALIAAGADVVLDPVDPIGAVEEILASVSDGIVSREMLLTAATRVNDLRQRLLTKHGAGIFRDPKSVFEGVVFGSPDHIRMAEEAACAAATLSDRADELIQKAARNPADVAVVVVPSTRSAPLIDPVVSELRTLSPELRILSLMPDGSGSQELQGHVAGAGLVVYVLMIRPAAWHAYGLNELQNELVRPGLLEDNALLAVLGSQDLVGSYPEASAWVCMHSDMPPSQRAFARLLIRGEC